MKKLFNNLAANIAYTCMYIGTAPVRLELWRSKINSPLDYPEHRAKVKELVDKHLEAIGNDDIDVTYEFYKLFGVIS